MDKPPKQPSEGFHSIPLQRLADKALAIERELSETQSSLPCFDQQVAANTKAIIELARIIRALGEFYS
jgi:hypothetical protein